MQALQSIQLMHLHERFPLRSYLALSALGLGCGFVGAMSGARIASNVITTAMPVPDVVIADSIEPANVSSMSTSHTEAMAAPSDKPGFVIEVASQHWFVLDVDPTTVTTHPAAKSVGQTADDQYVTTTIAALRTRDLTPTLRAWRGQRIDVNGCIDTLHDFALVHTLTGDPAYADDVDSGKWSTHSIDEHGAAYIVAKLEHCEGSIGRAVSAPPLVKFEARANDALASQATELLMASPIAAQVRAEFLADSAGNTVTDYDKALTTQTVEGVDIRTGTTWIAVHVDAGFACGGPNINFWGLYRAVGDHLVTIKQARLESIASIDSMVDVDGDGVPELLGSGWLSPTTAVFDIDEQTLISYDVPFFGCPC